MKRTMIFGLMLAGGVALASGCSNTPAERDYHEYSSIHANQHGYGDSVGSSLASQPSMAAYPKAANPKPRYTTPTYTPRQTDIAELPED